MSERRRLLILGDYRNAHHDNLEDAVNDLLDATENHYNTVLGCEVLNEREYLAMMHAVLQAVEAIRNLYVATGQSFSD